MASTDGAAVGECEHVVERDGVACVRERSDHRFGSAIPCRAQVREFGQKLRFCRIDEVREDVDVESVAHRRELDGGDQGQPGVASCDSGLGEAGNGIVVGDGQNVEVTLQREGDEFGGRRRTVRGR